MAASRGDGDQSRFGDGGAKAQGKGKQHQPEQAALAGQGLPHALTDGKEPLFQTEDKAGQPQHHQYQPESQLGSVGQGLMQDYQLKEEYQQYHRRQIAQAAEDDPRQPDEMLVHRRQPPCCVCLTGVLRLQCRIDRS